MLLPLSHIFISIFSYVTIVHGATISINPDATVPSRAIGPIDHGYLGLGIESASFPDYSGNLSSPNNFSVQLIENLSNRTGTPVYIRVGGTSLDNATYDPSKTDAAVSYPPGQFGLNVPFNITLGLPWFEGFQTLTAQWILDVPLQFASIPSAVTFAAQGLNSIGLSNLYALELGNEPNFYPNINPQSYVTKWLQYASAVSANLSLSNSTIYQGLTIASGSAGPPWDVTNLFNLGANAQHNLKTVGYHHYQAFGGNNISHTLLNHTDTRTHVDVFRPDISALSTLSNSSIPFVLSEVGSALNPPLKNGTQPNDFQLESVLGSAIWTVDFLLYAMTMGVDLVSMQQITMAGYSAWRPVAFPTELYGLEQPAVLPPYFGYLFVADFIGNGTNGPLKATNLDLLLERAAGYAGYEGDKLTKIALVNTEYWETNFGTAKPAKDFDISLPEGVESVLVQKLTGGDQGGASAHEGISWAGQEFTYASGGKGVEAQGGDTSQVLKVSGGCLDVSVPAVEAWLITLNYGGSSGEGGGQS